MLGREKALGKLSRRLEVLWLVFMLTETQTNDICLPITSSLQQLAVVLLLLVFYEAATKPVKAVV